MATTTTTTKSALPQGDYMKCYAADRYIMARDFKNTLATAVAEQCPICVGQTDYYNTADLRRALGTEFFREMECEVVTYMIR